MKRQLQAIGTRKWYGWDFLSLQEEPLKVLDGFFTQYGNFIISGCEISYNGSGLDVAPGLVALTGKGPDTTTVKMVVPFAGLTNTSFPIYLTLGYETVTDIYKDGKVKPVTHVYQAVASTVKPADNYIEINAYHKPDDTGPTPRFLNKLQDANHRFVTDNERAQWNKAAIDVRKNSEFDYIVDSLSSLAGLYDNAYATNVLIKKGTYNTGGIRLHTNTKRIVAEPGSLINYAGSGTNPGASAPLGCFYYENRPDPGAGYSIEGVNIMQNGSGSVFNKMVNLKNCKVECAAATGIDKDARCFTSCLNLTNCSGIMHKRECPCQIFDHCENLAQCRANVDKDYYMGEGFRYCNGVLQSYCTGKIFYCYNMFMCKSTAYNTSYFSSTAIAANACADTLNGGWNQTITV